MSFTGAPTVACRTITGVGLRGPTRRSGQKKVMAGDPHAIAPPGGHIDVFYPRLMVSSKTGIGPVLRGHIRRWAPKTWWRANPLLWHWRNRISMFSIARLMVSSKTGIGPVLRGHIRRWAPKMWWRAIPLLWHWRNRISMFSIARLMVSSKTGIGPVLRGHIRRWAPKMWWRAIPLPWHCQKDISMSSIVLRTTDFKTGIGVHPLGITLHSEAEGTMVGDLDAIAWPNGNMDVFDRGLKEVLENWFWSAPSWTFGPLGGEKSIAGEPSAVAW